MKASVTVALLISIIVIGKCDNMVNATSGDVICPPGDDCTVLCNTTLCQFTSLTCPTTEHNCNIICSSIPNTDSPHCNGRIIATNNISYLCDNTNCESADFQITFNNIYNKVNITCIGSDACKNMKMNIINDELSYANTAVEINAYLTPMIHIECNGLRSCYYINGNFSVYGNVDITCIGQTSCYSMEYRYNPPKQTGIFQITCLQNNASLSTRYICTGKIYGLTAESIQLICGDGVINGTEGNEICRNINIYSPLWPFQKNKPASIATLNSQSVYINCNNYSNCDAICTKLYIQEQITVEYYDNDDWECEATGYCWPSIGGDPDQTVLMKLIAANKIDVIITEEYHGFNYNCAVDKNCYIFVFQEQSNIRQNQLINPLQFNCPTDGISDCVITVFDNHIGNTDTVIQSDNAYRLYTIINQGFRNTFMNTTIHARNVLTYYSGHSSGSDFNNAIINVQNASIYQSSSTGNVNLTVYAQRTTHCTIDCWYEGTCANTTIYLSGDHSKLCIECQYDHGTCDNLVLHHTVTNMRYIAEYINNIWYWVYVEDRRVKDPINEECYQRCGHSPRENYPLPTITTDKPDNDSEGNTHTCIATVNIFFITLLCY